ncbi:MAG: YhfC family glutamic-type intramembrane protease, partial [Bacillota bacterium]
AVLVGALTFVFSQLVLRVPLLDILSTQSAYESLRANSFLYILFLSLTAGIFEEGGRYLAFRHFLRGRWSWRDGIAFGIGHGGIEAFLLVGLTYVANLIYSFSINAGNYMELLGAELPPEAAEMIRDQLVNLPASTFAAAGFERLFSIALHIALSLMVLVGVSEGKRQYLLYAVLIHAAANFGTSILASLDINVWLPEAFLALVAAASVWYIFAIEPRLGEDVPMEQSGGHPR